MINNKAVFLDRDGIINKLVERDGQSVSPRTFSDFKLKCGVASFLNKIKSLGFLTIIITNQPDIARKLMKKNELKKMHDLIKNQLAIDQIHICPHDDSDECLCRKPKPGMLTKAAEKHRINLINSFIVGDTWKDIEAGKRANCKTILWQASYNKDIDADFKVKSFREIIKIIQSNN